MKKIKKILIVNRSEIASRIIATCKALNIRTVALYSKQDKFLDYVFQADENYFLSKDGGAAYLEQDEVIDIAKKFNVDAIHPGYGFLSENFSFAQKVIDANIIWIGPNPSVIRMMADKINAKNIMQNNKVNVIPGRFVDFNITERDLYNIAQDIGYPVIVKDPLSGGGKGIKKVYDSKSLISNFDLVKSESCKYTHAKQILIEKFILNPKHIEVQVAGDGINFVHLYERDCSIQRRHQKIIEEAPASFLNNKILDEIYKLAILAIKAINYDNIGTVEFLVKNKDIYFLEVNTRLQVEHSVTEQITGIDLVELQILLAQNKKLKLRQSDIKQNCHAIECRIYSEDSENNFIPSSGLITNLHLPNHPYIRLDHNITQNCDITPFFDPMIVKVTSWGFSRDRAIFNMISYLDQIKIDGIKTNICFLKEVLITDEFKNGKFDTQILERKKIKKTSSISMAENDIALIIASLIKKKNEKSDIVIDNSWREQLWR